MFRREVRAVETVRNECEVLTAEVDGYEVYVTTEQDGATQLRLYPADQNGRRLGHTPFNLNPRSVAELEAFADVVGDVLRKVAAGLRAAGKDDLRSSVERHWDEQQEDIARRVKEMVDGH